MKLLILTSVLLGSIMASAKPYSTFENVREEFCQNRNIDYKKDILYCEASNSQAVVGAKVGNKLTDAELKSLKFNLYGAVDAGIVPDADSNTAYFFVRWLLSPTGAKVGVITFEGWYNTEMESSARFDVRYNLKGQTVMASTRSPM
jgi:hypothetical protein